jgi:ketosteroid isomerase-like protein
MATDLQITSTIQNLGQNFADAFKRRDFKAVGSMYAEDAVMLPPGAETIVGQSSIQLFWGRNPRIEEIRFEPTSVKPLGADAARDTGSFVMRVRGAGQMVKDIVGKYVMVWQKVDGEWKIETSIWNRNIANRAGGGRARPGGRAGGQGARRGQGAGRGQGQGGGAGRGQGQGGGAGRGQGQGGGAGRGQGQGGGAGRGQGQGAGGAGRGQGQGGGAGRGQGQGGGGRGQGGQGGGRGQGGRGGGQGGGQGGGAARNPAPFVPRLDD